MPQPCHPLHTQLALSQHSATIMHTAPRIEPANRKSLQSLPHVLPERGTHQAGHESGRWHPVMLLMGSGSGCLHCEMLHKCQTPSGAQQDKQLSLQPAGQSTGLTTVCEEGGVHDDSSLHPQPVQSSVSAGRCQPAAAAAAAATSSAYRRVAPYNIRRAQPLLVACKQMLPGVQRV